MMQRRDFLRLSGAAVLAAAVAPDRAHAALSPGTGVYDVRQYGAKGDGAHDDTTPIRTAIQAALSAGGGIVWFPTGTYCTGSQLLHGGVTLQGAGWQSVLRLLPGANCNLLETPRNRANYYGVVRDLCLDGFREANARGDVISLYGATGYRLDGLRIKNAARHAVYLAGDARYPTIVTWIVDSLVVNCSGNGIQPSGFACDCKIRSVDIGLCDKGVVLPSASFLSDVTIWQCNTGLYGYWAANSHLHMVRCERSRYSGFRFEGCTDIAVDQCRAYENNQSRRAYHGFHLSGTEEHPCQRLSFTGCMAGLPGSPEERQVHGFSDNGSDFVDCLVVHGCTARGNTKSGYELCGEHNLLNANL